MFTSHRVALAGRSWAGPVQARSDCSPVHAVQGFTISGPTVARRPPTSPVVNVFALPAVISSMWHDITGASLVAGPSPLQAPSSGTLYQLTSATHRWVLTPLSQLWRLISSWSTGDTSALGALGNRAISIFDVDTDIWHPPPLSLIQFCLKSVYLLVVEKEIRSVFIFAWDSVTRQLSGQQDSENIIASTAHSLCKFFWLFMNIMCNALAYL